MAGRISPELYVLQIVRLRRLRNPVSPRVILKDVDGRWRVTRWILKSQARARLISPPA